MVFTDEDISLQKVVMKLLADCMITFSYLLGSWSLGTQVNKLVINERSEHFEFQLNTDLFTHKQQSILVPNYAKIQNV